MEQLRPVRCSDRQGDEDNGADAVRGCLGEEAVDDALWRVGEQDLPVVLEAVRAAGRAPVWNAEGVLEFGRGFGVSGEETENQGVVRRGESVDGE